MVCENADRQAVSSPALPFLSVASDNGPSSIASKCHGEAKQEDPQTVLSGVHQGGVFGIVIVASLAVACSTGDDEADVPASAWTAVTAGTTVVAEDESAAYQCPYEQRPPDEHQGRHQAVDIQAFRARHRDRYGPGCYEK